MLTWAYHYRDESAEPQSITLNGERFKRIERLPRNVRAGDVLSLFDGLDRAQPHSAYGEVTGVDYWPQSVSGWRVYPATAVIRYRVLEPYRSQYVGWRLYVPEHTYRGAETRERIAVYRAVKR